MSIFKVRYADEHRTHEELLQSMTLAGPLLIAEKLLTSLLPQGW
jgi:hypothetical protein